MRFACGITKATHTRKNTHTHTHTHTEYVIHVSFSTTVVMRTHLNVALYVPCLSLWETVFCYWWYTIKKTSASIVHKDGEEVKNAVKKRRSFIYQFHSGDKCSRKSWTAPAGLRGVGHRGGERMAFIAGRPRVIETILHKLPATGLSSLFAAYSNLDSCRWQLYSCSMLARNFSRILGGYP